MVSSTPVYQAFLWPPPHPPALRVCTCNHSRAITRNSTTGEYCCCIARLTCSLAPSH